MSEELTPMDRMELWMSALNEAITNGTENSFMPYNRYELWMKKLCEAILANDPADPDVVEAFVNDWLDAHPEATTTVEDGAVTTAKLSSEVFDYIESKDKIYSFHQTMWENGSLGNSGEEIPDSGTDKRYRTDFIPFYGRTLNLFIPRFVNLYGYRYDKDKQFLGYVSGGWLGASAGNENGFVEIAPDDETAYYRFVMRAKVSYTGSDRAITQKDRDNTYIFLQNDANLPQTVNGIDFTIAAIEDYKNLTITTATNRATCFFIPTCGKFALFTIPSGYQAYVYQYDADYQYLRENGWSAGHFARGLDPNTRYLRFVIKTDNGSTTPTLTDLKSGVSIVYKDSFERVNVNPIMTSNALLAHRGYAVTAPENTIPAIELAAEYGYKMVEIDLQFTSDGVCVLLHDNTIDRTSNGTGNVYDMTYEQLQQYDFGSWKSSEYAGTKIPTLKEALLTCKYYGMCAQLDIADTSKTNITEANLQTMIDVIMECGMVGNVNVCAENDRARIVGYLKQGLCLCIGVGDTEGKFNARKDIKEFASLLIGSNSTATATDDMLKRCHDNNMPYQIWTVDSVSDAKSYYRNGYDWIISDSLKPSDLD